MSRLARAAMVGTTALGALRQRLQRRRFRAYCVGAPKSGTRSIAGMFESSYRSRHEPAVASLTRLAERAADVLPGPLASDRAARAAALRAGLERLRSDWVVQERSRVSIARRDLELWLELESSFVSSIVVEILVTLFEEAKFILTIRHPRKWLDSMFDQHPLLARLGPREKVWPDMWFGFDRFEHPPEERVLAEAGLYSLEGYLGFWQEHYSRLLMVIPRERLLILETDRIGSSAETLARLLEVPADSLDYEKCHLNPTRRRFGLAGQLDPAYLDDKIRSHCGSLLHLFSPSPPAELS